MGQRPSCTLYSFNTGWPSHIFPGHYDSEEMVSQPLGGEGAGVGWGWGTGVSKLLRYFSDCRVTLTSSSVNTCFLIQPLPRYMHKRLLEKQGLPTLHLPILLDRALQLLLRRHEIRHPPRQEVHGDLGGKFFILSNRFLSGSICSTRNDSRDQPDGCHFQTPTLKARGRGDLLCAPTSLWLGCNFADMCPHPCNSSLMSLGMSDLCPSERRTQELAEDENLTIFSWVRISYVVYHPSAPHTSERFSGSESGHGPPQQRPPFSPHPLPAPPTTPGHPQLLLPP